MTVSMRRKKQISKAFGLTEEWQQIAFPPKTSNVHLSRVIFCKRDCTYCFPHGWEMSNSTVNNRQRNWKRFRSKQHKEKKKG
jgi:hypothetical protein